MSSICSFLMKVVGTEENITSFLEIVEHKKDTITGRNGLSVDYVNKHDTAPGQPCQMTISGTTVNSLYSSLLNDLTDCEKEKFQKKGKIIIDFPSLCKSYDITSEIFSEADDIEEYVLCKPDSFHHEEAEFYNIWFDDRTMSKKDYEEEYDVKIPQGVWDNEDFYRQGGYLWKFSI
ncbi:hypothetical protein M2146_001189 [Lachnospiraceae bacterium PF1-22]